MAECGHTFSGRRIVDFLKGERRDTSVETVLSYLSACEEAFLIARVPRQDLVGKRILAVDGKILLTMDRLDMSDGTIRHIYIPDFLA